MSYKLIKIDGYWIIVDTEADILKGDEFDKEDVKEWFLNTSMSSQITIYKIKGPCGHFH